MYDSKDECIDITDEKKGTSNNFFKIIVSLTIIFSMINIVCIFNFYKILINL